MSYDKDLEEDLAAYEAANVWGNIDIDLSWKICNEFHMSSTGPTGGIETNSDWHEISNDENQIIRNLDFTVTLRRKSDNSVSVVNFNAIWGTSEYVETKEIYAKFNAGHFWKTAIKWENCKYYVDDLSENF